MTAQLIDGKSIAAQLRADLKAQVDASQDRAGRPPCLAVVLVGDDPASAVYVRNKERACGEVGIRSIVDRKPADMSQADLIARIDALNKDPDIDGILVQLPLPGQIDADAVLDRIDPAKDVDGFHPVNMGRLVQRRPGLRPCTPFGVIRMLQACDIPIAGQRAVVVGASNIVGRPMALELLLANATVTICNSKTRDLPKVLADAEIIVAGIGKPAFIQGDWVPKGAAVIDVGINRGDDGKLVGDVDFAAAAERAAWISPVPGGVGPMTIAVLLENTVKAWSTLTV